MWLLTLRDLQYRRLRVVVVVLLAGVVLALLYLMTGLVNQFSREPFVTTEAFAADHWVLAEGVSGPFTSGGAIELGALEELAAAVPVVISRASLAGADSPGEHAEVVMVGASVERFAVSIADNALAEGEGFAGPGEVVLDRSTGFDVGETVQLGPHEMRVVGLTTGMTVLAGVPLVYVELGTAQDLAFQNRDVVSAALLDGPRPEAAPAGTTIRTSDEVAEDTLGPLEDALASIDVVRGLLWLVAGVIIGAVVFLSALERQRDFAILRAMGTPKRSLLVTVAVQAVLVALVGAAIATVLQRLLLPLFPLPVIVPGHAYWQVPLGAVVVALVAGAAGLRKVAAADPAAAFAGAGA